MTGYTNLYLYKNTKFYKHQNYAIDDINSFLATLQLDKLSFDNLQYLKLNFFNEEIKIPFNQKGIKNLHQYNYARAEIYNDDGTKEREVYYYVDKIEWISSDAVRLKMTCDTLNSFLYGLEFHPKTFIVREHCDRWDYNGYYIENGTMTILRHIEKMSEGLNPQLFNKKLNFESQYQIEESNTIYTYDVVTKYYDSRTCWALIQWSNNDEGIIETLLLPIEYGGNIQANVEGESRSMVRFANFPRNLSLINQINIVPYSPSTEMENPNQYSSTPYNWDSSNLINATSITYENNGNATTLYALSINPLVSRRNGALTPLENHLPIISDGIFDEFHKFNDLFIKILTKEFTIGTIASQIKNNGYFIGNDYSNESSLYHSEFLQLMFFYSEYDYIIQFEKINISSALSQENFKKLITYQTIDYPFMNIRFRIGLPLDSSFTFIFNFSSYFNYEYSKSKDGIYMYCQINNKQNVFNSDYLNYLRNGINYDIKIRDVQRTQRQFEYSKSYLESGISSISVNAFKNIRGLISLPTNAYYFDEQKENYTRMQEDLQMEKNLAQLSSSKISTDDVNGGLDKIELLNKSNRKLRFQINAPSKTWWKYLEDYFYYFGNKVQYYGIPTHNNRCLFDYLKCKAEFVNRNNVPNQEALQDIIQRLDSGVTFIHKYLNKYTFDSDYKENVENRLLEIIQGE